MAYTNTRFIDRSSQHPNRRRLVPVKDSNNQPIENLYDIEREEGTISNAGTPFNAKTMNLFDNNISAAFGDVDKTLNGMRSEYVKSTVTITVQGEISSESYFDTYGKNQYIYYRFGNICVISIFVQAICKKLPTVNPYLEISGITPPRNKYNVMMPCYIATKRDGKYSSEYLFISGRNPAGNSTICKLDPERKRISFHESTGVNRVYVEKGTEVEIMLSGAYYYGKE